MKLVGDATAGFSAGFDEQVGAVRVRGWGFWSASVSDAFTKTVLAVCVTRPKGVTVLMDMTALKPLRDEGQRSFGALARSFGEIGVGRTLITTASHLTKLQLMRLATEHGAKNSIEFTTLNENGSTAIVDDATQKERTIR